MHFYLEPFKCYNASKLMILQYDAPANGEAQGGVKGKGRIGEGRGKGSGPLQRAFTTQRHARLVAQLSPRDHVTSAMRDLHWLPEWSIALPINSACSCTVSKFINRKAPPYPTHKKVTATSGIESSFGLKSASSL